VIPADRPRESRGRLERLLPCALFILLVAAVYSDALFLRRNFGGQDPLGYRYPMEKGVHDAWARGRLPVWMPEVSGGRPLLANPNAGALYPARPFLALVSFPLAMRLFPLLHWAAAGIGMLLLLSGLGLSRGGAWIGAVTYVFSGVSVAEVLYSNTHPGVALLPWALWALHRPASNAARGILTLSLFWALLFLAGDVFGAAIAFCCSLLWILLESGRGSRGPALARLSGALGLAILAAAPQILATALWIPETHRGVLGLSLSEVVLFSVSPFRLLELAIPFPFGAVWDMDRARVWGWPLFHFKQLGFFSSLYAGAFAVIALATTRRSRESGARFARLLFLAALAACVLPSLLPAAWGSLPSPVALRYPEKFAAAMILALGILSALAFDFFRRPADPPRWPLTAGLLLALLAAAAFFFPLPCGRLAARVIGAGPALAGVAARELPAALTEAGLLWIATVVALEALKGQRRRGLFLSLALLTLVPIAANRRIARTFPEDVLFAPTPFARFQERADPAGSFRAIGESAYRPASRLEAAQSGSDPARVEFSRRNWDLFTPALWGRGTVFNMDFDSGDLSRLESLRRVSFRAAGSPDAADFFGSLGLRWGVRYRDQPPLPGYHGFRGDALTDWDEHDRAYPDIRLLEKWREETGAIAALNILPRLSAGEIVIESGSRVAGSARPGRLRILEKTPERLTLETETGDPTWLFVLRGYWTYRTVLLDGGRVEDAPAQLAFSAVRVPAGRHRIQWTETVPGGAVSRFGPVLFALLAVGCVFAGGRRWDRS
jgi:hypothetical protein